MKVLFLNPPFKTEYGRFSRASRSPAISKSGTIYYPIWLAYAAGVVEKAGYEVKLVDSCADGYNEKETLKIVKDYEPKLIVLDTSTPSIYNDAAFAGKLKDVLPNSFVVLVGTHPSALPEETLKLNHQIDAVARQEYDYTLKDLAEALSKVDLKKEESKEEVLSKIDGLSFRVGDKVIHNRPRGYIQDLDSLPFVSEVYKKHLNIKNYFASAATYPMVMIVTGRGCPGRCSFCLYPQTLHSHQYRSRSPENIVAEFEYITEKLPEVQSVCLEDDTFTLNKERVKKTCQLLIDKGIQKKIKWWANVRVNTLDLQTMQLMKKAGCRLVIAGFESGNQKILDNINKGIKLEDSRKFMKNARQAKLLVHGCFMFGNPGETKETMEQTLEFAKELNPDTAQFFPLIPYPGTEIYQWAKSRGYLKDVDFDDWLTKEGLHNTIIDTENLTAKELVAFCSRARRKFYLRPKYIFYKVKQCFFNYQELKRNYKSFFIFWKHLYRDIKQKS